MEVHSLVVEVVHEALLAERQIEVEYRKTSGEVTNQVRLHPLALIQRGQITYLAATAYDYSDVRLYAVHRIAKAEILNDPVVLQAGCLEISAGRWHKTMACTTLFSPPVLSVVDV